MKKTVAISILMFMCVGVMFAQKGVAPGTRVERPKLVVGIVVD